MSAPFSFTVPTAVRFGSGVSRDIASVLPQGARHVALIRGETGSAAGPVREALAQANVATVEVTCPGEPSVPGINAAVDVLQGENIDALVAVGGGSVIDTGKAVAFCLGHDLTLSSDFSDVPSGFLAQPGPLPCIAVPTTAGTGAEVTANAVLDIPELKAKVSLRGRALFPANALVDPDLLQSAPASVLLASGLDAVVQTIEAYTSAAATPFSDALVGPNIAPGLNALKSIMNKEASTSTWRDMAWVSLSSGIALANGGLGAAHGIASVLGARYAAPHGALCGRLLVPVLRRNRDIATSGTVLADRLTACATQISEAFPPVPGKDELSGLEAWMEKHALPRLHDLGVKPDDMPALADASERASSSKKNPVPLTPSDFMHILRDAL